MTGAALGSLYGTATGDESVHFADLSTTDHRGTSHGFRYYIDQDDEGIPEAKRRQLEGGDHRGVDPRRAGAEPAEGSEWLPSYLPEIHGVGYSAQHDAGRYAVRETVVEPPGKAAPVQYFDVFPSQSVPVPGRFAVSEPTVISPGSFTTGDSPSEFSPAGPQPRGESHGFWPPDSVAPQMFNTGFDRGTAGFPSPTVCPRTDGLPVCNHTWTTGLPPAVSMGDFRQQNALGRCYLPAAPAGHPQSPFPPSPLNSSGVSTNSSPFPKTPADSAFAYYGYGPFLRRNQGGQAPSAVTMEQARAADFHFQPVNAVPSPDTARVFSSRTLSSPPPHDNAEIKFRATSPPDSGERWSAATNDQTEPSFREPQSQGQAGPQAGPTGKDAKLGQELARNDTTPRVAEGPPKPRPKIRTPRPLDPDTKTRICETRRMGACLRCHNQRAKCEPNKDDPGNPLAPCTTCQGVKKGTKKTIHNLPCFRYKLTEILLYRCGGLGYTKRFTHEELVDIEGIGEQHVVYMTSDFAKTAIKLEVRLFQPSPDDILVRRFLDDDGVPREVPLPPYCLASIKKTSEEFDKYIQERALNGLLEAAENVDVPVIIRRTFEMIAKYCDALTETVTVKRKQGQEIRPNDQKELLLEAVRLWFAIRHGIGTSTLSGEGSEGLEPIHVQASAFPKGTAPNMPRMIVAQFDSIRHVRIYKRLFPKVLKLLEKVLTSKNMGAWFTAYLVTFLFLDLVGSASEDRHRWAHANSGGKPLESRYGTSHLAGFVEDLHWAGVVILMHWHYFKRVDLLDMKEWESPGKTALKWLNPEEVNFVKHTVLDLRLELDEIPTTPGEGCWDNSMFWVSQMFRSTSPSDYKWAPPEIFAREKPSVGRDTPHLSCRRRKPKRR